MRELPPGMVHEIDYKHERDRADRLERENAELRGREGKPAGKYPVRTGYSPPEKPDQRLPARQWAAPTPADVNAACVAWLKSRGWVPKGDRWVHPPHDVLRSCRDAVLIEVPALLEWVARLELRLQDLERAPKRVGADDSYYQRIAEDAIARDKWGGR